MVRHKCRGLLLLLACRLVQAETPAQLSFPPAPGMTRADIHHIHTVPAPLAVLVLCPGCNGSGKNLIATPVWHEFALQHNLGLTGISFASEIRDLHNGAGYYYAHNGSGKILLDGIQNIFGKDLPILMYGFSGGAHFTARFVEWQPKRIVAWCAYSAGWWDAPKSGNHIPPGIVACGENDARLGASLMYFKQGRAIGKPWLWLAIPNNGHSPDMRAEAFIRKYFAAMLAGQTDGIARHGGLWVDVDTRTPVKEYVLQQHPSVTAWLPDANLLEAWQLLTGW